LKCKLALVLSVIVWVASFSALSFAASNMNSPRFNLNVCILKLPGVENQLVGNLNWSVEGALDASNVSVVLFHDLALGVASYDEPVNIATEVIADWGRYKDIVETESNLVVVNAHGDVLPVPSNCTQRTWVAKIAEAIAYRNLTWVHTGGYPFYYTQSQGGNESIWGPDGFMSFVASAGLTSLQIIPVATLGDESFSTKSLFPTWNSALAFFAEGYILNTTNSDQLVCPIWGDYSYSVGAVFKIAGSGLGSTGFYVDVSASRVFDSTHRTAEDDDYVRSYVGTAHAIYTLTLRYALEKENNNLGQSVEGKTANVSALWSSIAVLTLGTVGGIGISKQWIRRRRRDDS
jgi:hypothetical protein